MGGEEKVKIGDAMEDWERTTLKRVLDFAGASIIMSSRNGGASPILLKIIWCEVY